jgi:3-deoxy-D-manno-octulosonic-acid transferase
MIIYAALYRVAILAYGAAIHIAALFNYKARLFVDGRKDLLARMREALAPDNNKRIWMHCASLGEFEQGRPVFEALRQRYPQYTFIITFFSPSGYEVRKDYAGADHVFYLPMDSQANADAFLDIVRPSLCIFVKYEFWYYYLHNIAGRKIPAISISAIFHHDQGFFKWYGGLQRHMLKCFTHIFVQDETSLDLLNHIKIKSVSVSGDTRFDRVIDAAQKSIVLPEAEAFTKGYKIIVAGSTWSNDELFLTNVLPQLPKNWKIILVPHEVNNEHIIDIESLFEEDIVRWSAKESKSTDKRVLLVDSVGVLVHLYRYADVAWIGGGFGKDGVHNVLEAAVYGKPCFYGPVFQQFREAMELIDAGGAFCTKDPADFVQSLLEMEDEVRYSQHATAARDYVYANGGATKIVANYINTNILGESKSDLKSQRPKS